VDEHRDRQQRADGDQVGDALGPPRPGVDVDAAERPDDEQAERDREGQPGDDVRGDQAPRCRRGEQGV
jgi:hypothetical protein